MNKFLMTTAALALLTTTAQAASEGPAILYNGKYWNTTYRPSNSAGAPMCVITGSWTFASGATGMAMLKWGAESKTVFMHIAKSTWRFQSNIKVPISITLDSGVRNGDGSTVNNANGTLGMIEIHVQAEYAQKFIEDFAASNNMVITFRSGNEPPWRAEMAGSAEASQAWLRCIAYLNNGEGLAPQATSPVPPQATSPIPQQATSPTSPVPTKPTVNKKPVDRGDV
jgi:hypothetical protein